MLKRCSSCEVEKDISEFTKDRARACGFNPYCRACRTAKRRKYHYKSLYNFSVEQRDELLLQQGGRCAICRLPCEFKGAGGAALDHHHASGRVRGVLCLDCNTGIGKLREDPALIRAAITYLER